jgi:hypothetical protein
MEAVAIAETLVNLHQTARRYNSENSHLYAENSFANDNEENSLYKCSWSMQREASVVIVLCHEHIRYFHKIPSLATDTERRCKVSGI